MGDEEDDGFDAAAFQQFQKQMILEGENPDEAMH